MLIQAKPLLECNRVKNPTAAVMDVKSDEYLQLKERVLLLERVILHTISFDLSIEHPDKYIIDGVMKMYKNRQIEYMSDISNKDRSKLSHELMQRAINFVNDSMCTDLCLKFEGKHIAHACIYLGGMSAGICPTSNLSWLDIIDVSVEFLVGKFRLILPTDLLSLKFTYCYIFFSLEIFANKLWDL